MPEIESTLIFCASSPLMVRVLGPTADYLGDGIRDFAEKRVKNIKNIFNKAEEKLKDKSNTNGSVPPRVLKHIIDDGSYVDNELAAEYFSGVLASSKSTISRDDRAITLLRTLNSMSTYEIRIHYILYRTYREIFIDFPTFSLSKSDVATKFLLFIPGDSLINALAIEEGEEINQILEHAIPGLVNRGLIGGNYRFGSEEWMKESNQKLTGSGLLTCPSLLGAQLFLAAHGYITTSGNSLCDPNLQLNNLDGIGPCKGAFYVN